MTPIRLARSPDFSYTYALFFPSAGGFLISGYTLVTPYKQLIRLV